jgi:hypothetical protein
MAAQHMPPGAGCHPPELRSGRYIARAKSCKPPRRAPVKFDRPCRKSRQYREKHFKLAALFTDMGARLFPHSAALIPSSPAVPAVPRAASIFERLPVPRAQAPRRYAPLILEDVCLCGFLENLVADASLCPRF